MRKFTNPLDNIHVASPCPANWNEMYGNDRKRFCGDCKLSVYNLSDMTRREAENLLINSEGRLCVRFFRRADGTVLTKNCPVGWQAVRNRVSKTATAVFSLIAGFFGGLFAVGTANSLLASVPISDVPAPETAVENERLIPMLGEVGDFTEIEGKVDLDFYRKTARPYKPVRYHVLGQVEPYTAENGRVSLEK